MAGDKSNVAFFFFFSFFLSFFFANFAQSAECNNGEKGGYYPAPEKKINGRLGTPAVSSNKRVQFQFCCIKLKMFLF
jgi:hypothetical protein